MSDQCLYECEVTHDTKHPKERLENFCQLLECAEEFFAYQKCLDQDQSLMKYALKKSKTENHVERGVD